MRHNRGLRQEKGQAIVFVSVALAVLVGIVGLAVDAGQLYAAKQRAQTIADAVVQAGVMDVYRGSNAPPNNSFGTARVTCPTSGGISPCSYAQQNGLLSSDTLVIDFSSSSPSFDTDPQGLCTVRDVNLSARDSPNLICATITRTVNTTLIRTLGFRTASTITARAIAAIAMADAPAPIVVTHPHLQDALTISSSKAHVQICGGPARSIEVNSDGTIDKNNNTVSPPEALNINGNAQVDLSKAGPGSNGFCTDATTYGADFAATGPAPAADNFSWLTPIGPHEHYVQPATPRPDPLAYLTEPSKSGLGAAPAPNSVNYNKALSPGCPVKCPDSSNGCVVYSPGKYSTGISISNKTAYFNPGLYYIDSGDSVGFQTGSNGNLYMMGYDSATGVVTSSCATAYSPSSDFGDGSSQYPYGMVVFNAGSGAFSLGANGVVNLTGALVNSSNYAGVIFWNARSLPSSGTLQHKFGGGGSLALQGTIYLNKSLDSSGNLPYNNYQYVVLSGNSSSNTQITGSIITNVLQMGGGGTIAMTLSGARISNQREVALVK